jgi:beta-phosphoglucomutase-like phosphatase (HAD superfamily)
MTGTAPVVTLSPRDDDAMLFDLDGVLTKMVSVHAAAWKKPFDHENAMMSGASYASTRNGRENS